MQAPRKPRERTIQAYDLDPPTRAEVEASLRRMLGTDGAGEVLSGLVERVGVPASGDWSLQDIDRVARGLQTEDRGLVKVVGRTLQIRLQTYRTLRLRRPNPRVEASSGVADA